RQILKVIGNLPHCQKLGVEKAECGKQRYQKTAEAEQKRASPATSEPPAQSKTNEHQAEGKQRCKRDELGSPPHIDDVQMHREEGFPQIKPKPAARDYHTFPEICGWNDLHRTRKCLVLLKPDRHQPKSAR